MVSRKSLVPEACIMKKVYSRCCGIDVHKKVICAHFKFGRKEEYREFGGTTRELREMAEWLKNGKCEMIAMESTGSYWKPVYNILEDSGLSAIVVNAQHMKNVPGRKTDASDAGWICDLLQNGLLMASYVPERQQRELRELMAYRGSLIKTQSAELNRLQKILEGANIKLSGTVANINGKTSRNLLDYVLSGRSIDLVQIEKMRAEHKIFRVKATDEQLVSDLEGSLTDTQRSLIKMVLKHIDELENSLKEIDDLIDQSMTEDQKSSAKLLETIPGIGEASSKAIIAVIGTNMERFPNASCLASWAGLCPGNNESAHKRLSGKTRKGNKLLRTTLTLCAHSVVKQKSTYFSAQYARISAHRGKKRAIIAVAHSMLIAIYHMLNEGTLFHDLGSNFYDQFNTEKKINSHLRRLKELGWTPELATINQA
jgi:transposase